MPYASSDAREAEELLQRLVDAGEAALLVLEIDAVRDVLEQRLEQVALIRELRLGVETLHRVTQRALERLRIEPRLDEILLRAEVDDLRRQLLVLEPAQHDDRQMRRLAVDAQKGLDAAAVRQIEIEQDHVELRRLELGQAVLQRLRVAGEQEAAAGKLREQIRHPLRNYGLILDEEKMMEPRGFGEASHGAGSERVW